MPPHPGVPIAAQLRERLDEAAHALSSDDASPEVLAATAVELAEIGEAFARMLDDFDWSPPGWHAVTVNKLVRKYASAAKRLARVEMDRKYQSAADVVPLKIVQTLIHVAAHLVGPLQQLGTRTSSWVYTYTSLGDLLHAFDWVLDLGETALADACATSRKFGDPEEKKLFDEMMKQGFARARLEFECT